MPKNGVWTFLSAPAPALKWTIVPASVILQQFISSCRQTLSFLLAPSTFFVSKTTADQQQYNKIKLYLLGRFEGRGKKGVENSKSPHPPLATKTPKGSVLKPQLTCSAPRLVSLLQGTSNLPGGLQGGTGPFSSGGCWNCNYREAVSGGKLTWISTHVPCVFHLQTCGLYSTFSFNREWIKRDWKRLQAQHYERPGPSLPAGAERERNCYRTIQVKILYYIHILLNRGGNK